MNKLEKMEGIVEVIAAAIEAIDAQRHEEAKQMLTELAQQLAVLVAEKSTARERVDAANEGLREQLMQAE